MENDLVIDTLRLSITDKCNLNCIYCDPSAKREHLSHADVLRYEEMQQLVRAFVAAGVNKVRITGGEPLIKKNFVGLVTLIKKIEGLKELSLTTNGVFLKDSAKILKEAGVDRINISLDTLRQDTYKRITGYDYYREVWQGIMAALAVGLKPVKLNVVLLKGINDDEVIDFAKLTFEYPLVVRFIEFFPTNERSSRLNDNLINNKQVKEKLTAYFGAGEETTAIQGNGPAHYQWLKGALAPLGFISSYSDNFCHQCNRLRIDCAGRIYSCLFSQPAFDARALLRKGCTKDELTGYIQDIIDAKINHNVKRDKRYAIEMSNIGG
jgi:cyclic pyranopterin phosphate synthase